MPQFIFVYHGGKPPESEEEGAREMALWESWFAGMGDAAVNPGNPVGMSKTVTASGVEDHGGANPVSGYSVIEAADIEAATQIAQGCPILRNASGTIEVAPIFEM